MYEGLLRDGRILRAMPFGFYYAPYLVTTLKHYDPVSYYEQLVGLLEHASAPAHPWGPRGLGPRGWHDERVTRRSEAEHAGSHPLVSRGV
jgi:hypothetical protein